MRFEADDSIGFEPSKGISTFYQKYLVTQSQAMRLVVVPIDRAVHCQQSGGRRIPIHGMLTKMTISRFSALRINAGYQMFGESVLLSVHIEKGATLSAVTGLT